MLVVSGDASLVAQIGAFLAETDIRCAFAEDRRRIGQVFGDARPDIALVDADLGADETIAACAELRAIARTEKLAVLVLIGAMDDASVTALLKAGADDFIGRHIKALSFRARIDANLRRVAAMKTLALKVHDSEALIEVTSRLVGSPDVLDNLHDVTMLIARELKVDRCSIVLVRPQRDFGLVVTSSDDPEIRSLAINLKRYPEITHAAKSGTPLIIENVEGARVLEEVLPTLKRAGVSSVALFPIVRQGDTLGVIFLRFLGRRQKFEEREIVFCQTVANAASIALRNAEILELLKAKTREVEKVQTEVQDQLRNLKRYEDFFMTALDGNVVLEQSGKVVFANPVAQEMIGVGSAAIQGRPFFDFLAPEERGSFDMLLDEFVRGETSSHVDFHLTGRGGEKLVAQFSAGSLFGEEGLMLLTMRDVTEERLMEQRLSEARERLLQGEKRAAMAELAGAAAHELNQPLTSIMTSLAFLKRFVQEKDKAQRIFLTMEQESERMAGIIRRLTRITSYTTKNYVGKAKIIDLESASDDEAASMRETQIWGGAEDPEGDLGDTQTFGEPEITGDTTNFGQNGGMGDTKDFSETNGRGGTGSTEAAKRTRKRRTP